MRVQGNSERPVLWDEFTELLTALKSRKELEWKRKPHVQMIAGSFEAIGKHRDGPGRFLWNSMWSIHTKRRRQVIIDWIEGMRSVALPIRGKTSLREAVGN